MVCTFFGHRDFPLEKEGELRRLLIHLIEKEGVDTLFALFRRKWLLSSVTTNFVSFTQKKYFTRVKRFVIM